MIKNFSRIMEVAGTPLKFDFNTMNTDELQLFQVYTDWDGKRIRFHMQKDKGAEAFVIKDHIYCPEAIQALEGQLSELILRSQSE